MTLEQFRGRLHGRAENLAAPAIRWLSRTGVTPDAVTYLALALSAAAAACLAGGAIRTAGVVWLVGSALDTLDGALARDSGTVNRQGAFFDSSFDRISEGLLLTAAVYHFAEQDMSTAAAVSAYALLASLMVSYTRARAEGLGARCKTGFATRLERVIVLGAGLVFDVLFAAVVVLAVVATVTTVQRLIQVRKTLSEAGHGTVDPDSGRR